MTGGVVGESHAEAVCARNVQRLVVEYTGLFVLTGAWDMADIVICRKYGEGLTGHESKGPSE